MSRTEDRLWVAVLVFVIKRYWYRERKAPGERKRLKRQKTKEITDQAQS